MAKPSPSYSGLPELVSLGAVIRDLRIKTGLSQEAFADKVGIDRSYIGGIERGEHNLALVNLMRIASALQTSTALLLQKAKI